MEQVAEKHQIVQIYFMQTPDFHKCSSSGGEGFGSCGFVAVGYIWGYGIQLVI